MRFQRSIQEGYAKKAQKDIIKAESLIKASQQAIKTASRIPLEEESYKSIVRELYEGLRQYCEALGFVYGYKFMSHESITYFIEEILKEESASIIFDRYRKIRNRINYYGDDVPIETVKKALEEIPKVIELLSKFSKL